MGDLEGERLADVAQRIPVATLFGRSTALKQLFEYLLERSLRDDPPREIDMAADVFGKAGAELLTDGTPRVYIHRLRKRLDEYYADAGRDEPYRLIVPKGEYRLRVAEVGSQPAPAAARSVAGRYLRAAVLLLAGVIAGIGLGLLIGNPFDRGGGVSQVRASAIWSPLVKSGNPLLMVVGDYYIFGERTAPNATIGRLVRDFSVNSSSDLEALVNSRPKLADLYTDLGLSYFPSSTGHGMLGLIPIFSPEIAKGRQTDIVPCSQLNLTQIKGNDIVYVGLLSGLGILRKPLFGNSRFALGNSDDEIVDRYTHKVYTADVLTGERRARRDYAYIVILPGPRHNRVVVASGTRDAAVMGAVDILASPEELRRLQRFSKDGFVEALYSVDGVGTENMRSSLIGAQPRPVSGIWEADFSH